MSAHAFGGREPCVSLLHVAEWHRAHCRNLEAKTPDDGIEWFESQRAAERLEDAQRSAAAAAAQLSAAVAPEAVDVEMTRT